MPENIQPIGWPADGLVEAWSFSEQPENSAREYQNVRVQDCEDGRLRGAGRSGQSKYVSSAIKASGTKVQDLISFTVDNRQVDYSALTNETTTWSVGTSAESTCNNLKTDRQGNEYALDRNANIIKYSADGVLVWQLAVPVADTNHIIRALVIDEFDNVYAGVSEGGEQEKAKLFCFQQLPDNKTEKLWEITTKAYIEEMKIVAGKLYTCQNRLDRKKAYVRVYEFADTISPTQSQEWRVPYPVNSITVKKDGAVVTASEPAGDTTANYFRDPDPKYPTFAPDSVDWTPMQLENAKRRIWAWYIGDSIDDLDVAQELDDGVEILRWRDSTENGRNFQADIAALDAGPVLALDSCLEHKGIRFTKTDFAQPFNVLKTGPNFSTAQSLADSQQTMVPAYVDSQFCVVMAIRPSATVPDGEDTIRWVWGMDKDNAFANARSHILYLNSSSGTTNPTASVGEMAWIMGPDGVQAGGGGSGGSIRSFTFTAAATDPDVLIVTMLYDGAVGSTGSYFQLNGNPLTADAFTGGTGQTVTLQPSYLGIVRIFGNLVPSGGTSGYLGDLLEIVVLDKKTRTSSTDGVLSYTTGGSALQYDSAGATQDVSELTNLVGYLAHKYGSYMRLPKSTDTFPHPYGRTGSTPDFLAGPPNQLGTAVSTAQAKANKRFGCVVKYSPEGKIVWCANEMETVSGERTGGYGYAVAVNSDGNIYSLGPVGTGGGTQDNKHVRLIIDQGDTFSVQVADGAWSAALPAGNGTYKYPKIDVDEFDNLYIPYNVDLGAAGARVYQKDGTVLHTFANSVSTSTARAVAVDRRIPDYQNDISPKRAEHVLVGTSQNASGDANVWKVRLVTSTQASGSNRTLLNVGVSGGDIKTFTTSAVSTPTNGAGALDSTARYIQSATLFKRVYFTDGRQYKQYDPVSNEITEYKCLSAGSIPARCSLIESWRGRIVLARSADEPHNWFMSKKDNPDDWDFFPPTPTETSAVAGNSSSAGLCPDIINSVVPYSEDIVVFGGDHSIWALVGDPAAGGRLELVSDITGMAFGRPWCKDPNGVLYFVGSRGGLFRWLPGGKPDRISLYKIERQLQEIDFADYFVRLVWNYADEGLHIFQCPFGAGATQVSHWFFEAKSGSFSKDIFGTTTHTNVQPCAVMVIDGDEFADRALLIGGEDGFVRKWDPDSKNDDTRTDGSTANPIDNIVTIFPIQPDNESATGMETQWSGLTVTLKDAGDGCRYELFASEEPDSFGLPRRQGVLRPGRNAPIWDKVTGPYCGLRLRNAAAGERFGFERAYIYTAPAGMVRTRVRN